MLQLTLLTIGLFTQVGPVAEPTMQFTNTTRGSISVFVYSKDRSQWENDKRPLVVRAGATASVTLREGNFQVLARNEYGVEDRNDRVLAARELDWMDFRSMNAGPQKPQFKIVEHNAKR